jgi:hypothetical protein
MKRDELVSHHWEEETPGAKARWFRSLRMEGRMQMPRDLTDIALWVDPSLPEKKSANATPGRIRVISAV